MPLPPLPHPALLAQLYAEAIARGDSFGPLYHIELQTTRAASGCLIIVATWFDCEEPGNVEGHRSEHKWHVCIVTERKVVGWQVMDRLWFRARPGVGASDYAEPCVDGGAS